ncbi:DUF448 domain-containing protein [Ferrovibrio sp.]|uniref:DUF448 domain-containing protein n=1 Tax=Ferrovibrio sp. TaxID=1917215 RepID=UPI00262289E7|nr:DUF448 domain-containing protein [Ferrovibrio sp.]
MPDGNAAPQRRCLLSGLRATPDCLLRFAVDATGAVVPDPAHRLPGRGLWLAPAPGAVAAAKARGAFARGAKRKLQVPEDLAARSVAAWTAHVAAQVAKARRAGLVMADAAAAETGAMLVVDAAALGFGRLGLRPTPFTGRLAADLALLARLVGAGI